MGVMKRRSFAPLFASLAFAAPWVAHAAESDVPSLAIPPAHARLGYEQVRFPGGGPRTGLVGTSYLVDLVDVPGLSLGPAVYGAVSGRHGGFFTLGGEAAWRQRLAGPFGIELGLFAGGGGGGGAPEGSGLMLRPHADVLWDLGPMAVGLSLSHVNISGGKVASTQLGLVLNAATDFRFVPAERLREPALAGGRAGLGFDRIQLVGGAYRTPAGRTLNDGQPLPRTISTLGVRAEQAWGSNGYWGVEALRAGRGGVGGYAEYLGTLGLERELMRNGLTAGVRVAAGAAGGGGVSTGGGLLVKAAGYGIVRISDEFGLALEAGYARAPNGNFRGFEGSAAIVWALDGPGRAGPAARPARTDFSVGAERLDAPRDDGSERPLTAVTLRLDRYLTKNAYVAGKVLSAAGGAASGYSGALVGAGWMQPFDFGGTSRLHAGAELLAGAAGGGRVDGRGALFAPRVYAGLQLTPTLALRAGAARMKALDGRLNSNVFDLGLVVSYGVSAGN